MNFRVEYEQNRDVGSRIRKLESSVSSLEADLEKIQKRKSELKELTEKATNEINNWKKEMLGIWFCLYLNLMASILCYVFSITRAFMICQFDGFIHSKTSTWFSIVHCPCWVCFVTIDDLLCWSLDTGVMKYGIKYGRFLFFCETV